MAVGDRGWLTVVWVAVVSVVAFRDFVLGFAFGIRGLGESVVVVVVEGLMGMVVGVDVVVVGGTVVVVVDVDVVVVGGGMVVVVLVVVVDVVVVGGGMVVVVVVVVDVDVVVVLVEVVVVEQPDANVPEPRSIVGIRPELMARIATTRAATVTRGHRVPIAYW